MAQVSVSPILEPNRIDQNFDQPLEAQAEPRIAGVETAPRQGGEFAPDLSFVLRDLRIEGVTAIDPEQLLDSWPHNPGDTVTIAELDALADRISLAYAEAGYALSFAFLPAQEIEDGSVTLKVVEGFIDEVVLSGPAVNDGALGRSRNLIRQMADKIVGSRPLRVADLERYLLLMNDLPGLTVKATLSPSTTTVGGSVMTLEIERAALSGDVGYSSFLPRELDRHSIGAAVRLNGYLTGSDQIRISNIRSLAADAYNSISGSYSTGLGTEGLRVEMATSYSRTEPTDKLLKEIEYVGEAVSARLGVSYPLIRSRERNLGLAAGINLNDSDVDVLSTPLQRDRVRTIDVDATYDFAGPARSVNLVRVGIVQGLDIFDARGDSRANGSPTYTVLDFDLQSNVPLATAGKGRLSAFASAYGQAALGNSLLSVAECGFGGRQYGRFFDAGAATGDHCLLGSAELRWTKPMDVSFSAKPMALQLYGVFDIGMIRQRGELQPEESRSEYGASGGAGVLLSLSDRLNAGFEATHSLRTPASQTRDNGLRLTGSLSLRF